MVTNKKKKTRQNSEITIYLESLPGEKRKRLSGEKKRKGQPCHTNWKKSRDTQSVGQKTKTHRKMLRCYNYKECSILGWAKLQLLLYIYILQNYNNYCIYIYIYESENYWNTLWLRGKIYMCVCLCVFSWAAVLHLSMFDLIIKTNFVYIILLSLLASAFFQLCLCVCRSLSECVCVCVV